MMGEGKRVAYNKRNAAEEKGKERKESNKMKGALRKAGVIAGGLLLAGALAKCTSDNGNPSDTGTDTDVPASTCDKLESSRANLQVIPGMGYDTEYDRRRGSDEDGWRMGVNEGEESAIVNPAGVEETWMVESIDDDLVVLKDLLSDRTMEIELGGSTFIDIIEDSETGELSYTNHFMEVYLLGACSVGDDCEGISTDVINATGRAIVAVSANGETKRVMLSDEEGTAVSVGGYDVTLTMAKATENQFNIVYSIDSGEKAELGEPVSEGETHMVNEELSITNEVSSDSATAECSTIMAVLKITDSDHVDAEGVPIPYERELEEGDTLEIGGKTYQIRILAELRGTRPFEQINWNVSGVELMDTSTGDREVKYKNGVFDLGDGKTIEVGEIKIYYDSSAYY